jgi:hypothetical protein
VNNNSKKKALILSDVDSVINAKHHISYRGNAIGGHPICPSLSPPLLIEKHPMHAKKGGRGLRTIYESKRRCYKG